MKKLPQLLDPWYVTGICEGEGMFTFSRFGNGNAAFYFAVKLTKTDQGLLYKIQSFFGVGTIYNVKPIAPGERGGYTKSAVYYRVTRLSELELIIEHFEKYPLWGEKTKRFLIWKKLVQLKKKNFKRSGWPNADWTSFQGYLQELSSLAPQNMPWDGGTVPSSPPFMSHA